jgi:hypothetical protein
VELLDLVLVAEAVAPPTAQIVYAIALHRLQQFPATVCRTHQFLLFLGLCFLGRGCAVLGSLVRYCGYAAEVAAALQHDGLVRVLADVFAGR